MLSRVLLLHPNSKKAIMNPSKNLLYIFKILSAKLSNSEHNQFVFYEKRLLTICNLAALLWFYINRLRLALSVRSRYVATPPS